MFAFVFLCILSVLQLIGLGIQINRIGELKKNSVVSGFDVLVTALMTGFSMYAAYSLFQVIG